MTASLLVELFVEELPPKALRKLGEAFAGVLADSLKAQGLAAAEAVVKKSIAKSLTETTIDPRHRAGFALRIGDRRVDATLRGQLMRLRASLLR